MGIDVRTMADGETVAFTEALALDVPKAYGVTGGARVAATGRVVRHGDAYTVLADCETALELACARCLRPVALPLAFELAELFAEDVSAHEGAGDVWPVLDKTIDLTAAVESALYSLIPSRALCREDCEGIYGLIQEE